MDELRVALELATEDELHQLTKILFSRGLNPLDYIQMPDVIEVQSRDREELLDGIEERFRYLAADGLTVLRGRTHQVSYRTTLIQVCRYLKIPYAQKMSAVELESEIFLHLVQRAWKHLPASEQRSLTARIQRSLAQSNYSEPLPPQLQHDPVNLLLKGGGIMAVNFAVKPLILQHIARQFALHFCQYQMAKTALIEGGTAAAVQIQQQLAVQAARRGMVVAASRQAAVRSAFAFLGPVLWASFVADLGWKAIATNYGRIIPAIFALAQIRLIRSECLEPAY
ncbi:hypothetical protein [Oscillatoria sp. FACHB-1406]|uniref:YaaW family protein n=1 Tax=Oscillatoria sp. FACHB-1406 TaxID=2692846 RepID=UPI0016872931|nr:hypothetical protein [Oscillatoria sp. FACHB-1406]MBD2576470.1 hypothetical protein [Oscillatoria sp. FACHB-1406]